LQTLLANETLLHQQTINKVLLVVSGSCRLY